MGLSVSGFETVMGAPESLQWEWGSVSDGALRPPGNPNGCIRGVGRSEDRVLSEHSLGPSICAGVGGGDAVLRALLTHRHPRAELPDAPFAAALPPSGRCWD